MKKYELAVVLKPELDEETKAAEMQKVQDLITRFGGTIEKIDDWGKKRLAEIESRMRIAENVLRYLIVCK